MRLILNKIINWSDLELALGKYIANLEKKEDLIKIHKDLRLNLIKYLKLVEANYNGDDSHKNKLFEDLREPEKYLPAIDHNKINVYRKELIKKVFDNNNRKGLTVKNVIFNQRWNTTVILFNYTNTFQRLTGFTNSRHIGNNDGNDIYHNILKFRKYLRQL
ncbi:MAG: AbiH family protein [Rikenellaceae bacterium]